MPLKGDYKWLEDEDAIHVDVPLKGIKPSIVDLLGKSTEEPYDFFLYNCEIGILQVLHKKLTFYLHALGFSIYMYAVDVDYVKVSYPPYLIELNLAGSVDASKVKATCKHGILQIKLQKVRFRHDSIGKTIEETVSNLSLSYSEVIFSVSTVHSKKYEILLRTCLTFCDADSRRKP